MSWKIGVMVVFGMVAVIGIGAGDTVAAQRDTVQWDTSAPQPPPCATYFDTIGSCKVPDLPRGGMRISVEGVLRDSEGHPVGGAWIALREEAPWRWARSRRHDLTAPSPQLIEEVIARTKTDSQGRYKLDRVPVLEKPFAQSASCTWHLFAAVADGRMVEALVYSERAEPPPEIRQRIDMILRDVGPIEGQCLDVDGRPIRGIEVRLGSMEPLRPADPGKHDFGRVQLLYSSIQPRVTTDQDGRFRFPAVPTGIFCRVLAGSVGHPLSSKLVGTPGDIEAARTNYSRADQSPMSSSVISDLASSPITLQAVEPAVLHGRVLGDGDRPLAKIKVSFSNVAPYVTTDDSGRFRLPGNQAWIESQAKTDDGNVSLAVGDYSSEDRLSSVPAIATYMNVMANVSLADCLGEHGAEIRMERGGIVRGKLVTAATGDPIAGVSVLAVNRQNPADPPRGFSMTLEDGSYRLLMPPSDYRLYFYGRLPGYELPTRQPQPGEFGNDSRFAVDVSTSAGKAVQAPLMVIAQLDPIDVHVQDAAGRPIAGASIIGFSLTQNRAYPRAAPGGFGPAAPVTSRTPLGPRGRTDDHGDGSLELFSRSWATATLHAKSPGERGLQGDTQIGVEEQGRIVITVK